MTDDQQELKTAAEAKFCENCGLIETVIPIQNFTREDKQPCEDNKMKDLELVRREDDREAREQARQEERQRILDLINQRIRFYEEKPQRSLNDVEYGRMKELKKLRGEIQDQDSFGETDNEK